jgi:anhydro-N-acetylmuramic acid kinase
MVIDAVMEKLFNKRCDRDGKVAASGRVLDGIVAGLLRTPFFRQKPPRTAGREEFGREYAARFLELCRGASKPNIVATATFLTAASIADAIERFVLPRFSTRLRNGNEMIVSGGGAKNPTLIAMLRDALDQLAIKLRFSDEFGIPSEAKEATAFALLAYETWHGRPSNVPAATGAEHPAILGKISYA